MVERRLAQDVLMPRICFVDPVPLCTADGHAVREILAVNDDPQHGRLHDHVVARQNGIGERAAAFGSCLSSGGKV